MGSRLSALGLNNYRSAGSMFKKRDSTWRPLKLITRLAFLPGVLVLLLALITLFSLLFSYSEYDYSRPSRNNVVDIETSTSTSILPPGHVSLHPARRNALNSPHTHNSPHTADAPSKTSIHQPAKLPLTPPSPSAIHPVLDAAPKPPSAQKDVPPTATTTSSTTPVEPASSAKETAATPTCKWVKYAKWPYVDEFPHLSPLRHKLLYIKTPKSSSSTIAHLMQRYTTREGLVVGYPDHARDEWTLDSKESFEAALKRANVPPRNEKSVDAICSHIVYRKQSVDKLLGTKRPFRVTSIREPVARSWSMFLHGLAYNLTDFSFGAKSPREFAYKMDLNGQSKYISGWNEGIVEYTTETKPVGDPADVFKHFDHVVLSGRVLESIVTLAPKLGLKVSDLLFFSQKAGGMHKKALDIVSREEKRKVDALLRERTQGDRQVYNMAAQRLNEELKMLPDKIKAVIADVKYMKKDVAKICGRIDAEDNSCTKKGDIIWDGNQVCQARCIEEWARKHVFCQH